MKRRWIILGATLLLVAMGLTAWLAMRPSMVPYMPIIMDHQQQLVDAHELVTPSHLDAVQRVLHIYDEPFQRTSPTVLLIRRELATDRDLLWNYTTKAGDEITAP